MTRVESLNATPSVYMSMGLDHAKAIPLPVSVVCTNVRMICLT